MVINGDSTVSAIDTSDDDPLALSIRELDRLTLLPTQLLKNYHHRPTTAVERSTYNAIASEDIIVNEDYDDYVIAQELPYDESLQRVILNEIYDILSTIYCKSNCLFCFTIYNPIYSVLFVLLFIVISPAVVLHWLLIDYVPIRVTENDIERKFRSHGIYTATGCAILGMVYTFVDIIKEQSTSTSSSVLSLQLLYLFIFSSVVVINLIALKAIADRLLMTIRAYIIAVWAMDFVLYTLFLCNLDSILHMTVAMMVVALMLSISILIICTIIARNAIYFWNYYLPALLPGHRPSSRKGRRDIMLVISIVMLSIVSLGLLVTIIIQHAAEYFQYIAHNHSIHDVA